MDNTSNSNIITAIVNGFVIDPASGLAEKTNVFIEEDVISEIGPREPHPNENVLDASGMHVVPGFIDLHTHLREPGQEYKEDIESGSRAAAAGGFTTILCMPNTSPPCDNREVARHIRRRTAEVGLVNVLPVGAITKGLGGTEISDIAGMAEEGIVAISDDGMCVQNKNVMRLAMTIAKELDILVIDHPEDFARSAGGVINDGPVARKMDIAGIPRSAESDMIARDLELAAETGCRMHIAHVSTKDGIELIRRAKRRGVSVTCEVAPHHLLLTEDDVERIGANAKMKPPLRTERDRLALISGLLDGTVDAIATDHAPHAPHEKGDLETAAFGVIGMETAFAACMKLVCDGHLTIEQLIRLLTIGPASVVGIRAGTISAGWPADIAIVDPNEEFTIDSSQFQSKARNTPFEGWAVKGRVKGTISGGRVIY